MAASLHTWTVMDFKKDFFFSFISNKNEQKFTLKKIPCVLKLEALNSNGSWLRDQYDLS